MILSMDRSVRRIQEALEAKGLAENTLVVFTSDNGGANYIGLPNVNEPYRGWKLTHFEGGLHVPFAARWPALLAANNAPQAEPMWPAVFVGASARRAWGAARYDHGGCWTKSSPTASTGSTISPHQPLGLSRIADFPDPATPPGSAATIKMRTRRRTCDPRQRTR